MTQNAFDIALEAVRQSPEAEWHERAEWAVEYMRKDHDDTINGPVGSLMAKVGTPVPSVDDLSVFACQMLDLGIRIHAAILGAKSANERFENDCSALEAIVAALPITAPNIMKSAVETAFYHGDNAVYNRMMKTIIAKAPDEIKPEHLEFLATMTFPGIQRWDLNDQTKSLPVIAAILEVRPDLGEKFASQIKSGKRIFGKVEDYQNILFLLARPQGTPKPAQGSTPKPAA